jgi:hypothetical protein
VKPVPLPTPGGADAPEIIKIATRYAEWYTDEAPFWSEVVEHINAGKVDR